MESLFKTWQELPLLINPEIFSVGYFSIRWYSLSYILAFLTILALVVWRIKKGEAEYFFSDRKKTVEAALEIFIVSFVGLLIGARLGYVIFYEPSYYLSHPLEIISPFRGGVMVGIFGMSYHGGLAGLLVAAFIYCRRKGKSLLTWANFIAPAAALGYFWGRLGNFFNGEIFGKPTDSFIGMYFPGEENLIKRHPTQIYEAVFEGLIIFMILWPLRNKEKFRNHLLAFYLILYGSFRFFLEYWRDPIFSPRPLILLTTGQVLCLAMVLAGVFLIWRRNRYKTTL